MADYAGALIFLGLLAAVSLLTLVYLAVLVLNRLDVLNQELRTIRKLAEPVRPAWRTFEQMARERYTSGTG